MLRQFNFVTIEQCFVKVTMSPWESLSTKHQTLVDHGHDFIINERYIMIAKTLPRLLLARFARLAIVCDWQERHFSHENLHLIFGFYFGDNLILSVLYIVLESDLFRNVVRN